MEKALEIANLIASKSPVAIYAIKKSLNFSRDHTVKEGFDHINLVNMALVQTVDI